VKIRAVTRRWWPVGVGAALGIAAALALVAVTPKSYTATSVLFLGAPASSDSSGAYNGDLFSQQRASTYSQVVTNRDLASPPSNCRRRSAQARSPRRFWCGCL
jgi:uncharacterized protein involved in exopolysaccharide biosynthesis